MQYLPPPLVHTCMPQRESYTTKNKLSELENNEVGNYIENNTSMFGNRKFISRVDKIISLVPELFII